MKQMINKQRGIGFFGWSSILGVMAFFVLIFLRIFPLYTEKLTVMAAMQSVANNPKAATLSSSEARKFFQKNIDISSSSERFNLETIKDLVKIEKDKKTKKRYIHVTYEGRNVFIKDIKFLIEFDHRVELGGSGGE